MPNLPKLSDAGAAVRQARQRLGLSLNDVAGRLGWDKGRLSKYETNELALSSDVLDAIAGALDCRPEVLLLECLRSKYPSLKSSKTGHLLNELIRELAT